MPRLALVDGVDLARLLTFGQQSFQRGSGAEAAEPGHLDVHRVSDAVRAGQGGGIPECTQPPLLLDAPGLAPIAEMEFPTAAEWLEIDQVGRAGQIAILHAGCQDRRELRARQPFGQDSFRLGQILRAGMADDLEQQIGDGAPVPGEVRPSGRRHSVSVHPRRVICQ